MKKILATFLLFIGLIGYSQTNGITYQAVIINPLGEQLPGVNNTNAPLANKSICLKFSIIDNNSQSEYIETVQTTTDEFGMVNLIIGTGVQIGGYASSFTNILWNANPKSLKVDLSTTGICSYYTEISNQPFTAVPFALFALNTESTASLNALQATVAANAVATTTALALKEDAANKSTITTLGTSNILFPTQNAVKTYVDTNISTVTANNTALQATVTANAIAATTAIAAVQADVNQNETDGDAADVILQNNINTLQNTVTSNATATTAALVLKEDAANKSTTTTLGLSDILFPTQNAVKTYVDTNITTVNSNNTALQAIVAANATAATTAIAAVQADVNQNETDGDAADVILQNNITTLQNTVTSNATATTATLVLKEDAANKSTTTTLGFSDILFPTQNAVKTYVDTNITTVNSNNTALQATVTANAIAATTAIAAVQADVNQNETDGDAADVILQNNINTLQNTVTSNATATTAALVLKEDAANKSTTTTLGLSDILFPTQNAVKTYVDGSISTSIITNSAVIAAIQADVDANEIAATNAITTLGNTVTANAAATTTALALKEDAANKSTDVTLADVSNTKFPTELAVKTFVSNQIATGTAANVSGIVSVANGGTGSSVQNFVDLITNQAVAGEKTFGSNTTVNANLNVNGEVSAPIVMVENGTFQTGTLGDNQWQSFTATSSGVLHLISIFGNGAIGARNGTLNIYSGTGTVGAQLYSGSVALPPFSGWFDLPIASSVNIVTGNIYTFQILDPNPVISPGGMVASENNLYPQGDYFSSVYGANSNYDLTFKAWISSVMGGNITASGNITAGSVTYPNTHGIANQVLTTNGSGTLAWSSPSSSASSLTGTLAIANGGTGSSVQNFVDLTNNQNIAGGKYFTNNITANQVSIGSPGIGSQNTMLGESSFGYASPGSNNTGLGFFTLASLNGGNDNTAVGTNAIRQGGTANGSRNTAVGSVALSNGGEPNDNTALGFATLAVTSGSSNTAVGSSALQNNTTASYNVGVGFETLRNTTTGGSNTAVGRAAMYSNTSGDVNTAVGEYALVSNTIGRYNTSVGVQAQEQNTTGQSNTAIGVAAIDRNTSGSNNAVLGAFAGRYINDGSTFNTEINNSVLIGAESTPKASNESNQIVIGYQAKGNGSNTIQLGNTSITNVNTSGSITANAEISSEITANLTIDNANAEQYKAKVLICNPTSPITITFGNDLPVGFNCMVLQKSIDANKINLAGGSGVTIKNRSNYTATAGNYAIATIVNIGGGIIVTAGDMQ